MDLTRLVRERVTLRDKRTVVLRPIRRSDAPLLMALHQRLSPDSQYLRFFGPKPKLSEHEAAFLAGVDFDQRFAIVGAVREDGEDCLIAVGRFDIIAPAEAECAIVVLDDYQGQGLGTKILERLLLVARGRGVRTFSGEVLAENAQMLNLLRGQGLSLGPVEGAVVKVAAPIEETSLVVRVFGAFAEETSKLIARSLPRRGEGVEGE